MNSSSPSSRFNPRATILIASMDGTNTDPRQALPRFFVRALWKQNCVLDCIPHHLGDPSQAQHQVDDHQRREVEVERAYDREDPKGHPNEAEREGYVNGSVQVGKFRDGLEGFDQDFGAESDSWADPTGVESVSDREDDEADSDAVRGRSLEADQEDARGERRDEGAHKMNGTMNLGSRVQCCY